MRPKHLLLLVPYTAALYSWHVYVGSIFAVSPSPPPPPTRLSLPLSPPPPPPPQRTSLSPPPPPPQPPRELKQATETVADVCDTHSPSYSGKEHIEYDGAVMVPGSGPGATVSKSPADCCKLCQATRGCNVWVGCTDPWCGNQCWLKWVEDPAKPPKRGSGGSIPWTSGALLKDVPGMQPIPSEASLDAVRIVAIKTQFGDVRIKLKPEWHLPSVRFVQAAALGDFCTVKCELYRAEVSTVVLRLMAASGYALWPVSRPL